MRYILLGLCMVLSGTSVYGQVAMDTIVGEVSYTTSQNLYVRFLSTKDIAEGDTLYLEHVGALQPALVVKYLSSTSCVGSPLSSQEIVKGTRIIAKIKSREKPSQVTDEILREAIPADLNPEEIQEEAVKIEAPEKKQIRPVVKADKIKGRITAASYINFSEITRTNRQRMRYTMTFNAKQLGNTAFSAESYISFRHTLNEWQDVRDNFKRAFKIYTLALRYDLNPTTRVWAGRKINLHMSNAGAIDGIQAEKNWGKMLTGVFAGSRPDHMDYGFNFNLLQYGAYASHAHQGKNGLIQSTIAIAEQRNFNMTDRRFAYFQHLNSGIKRLNIFTSFEFDLYTLKNNQPTSTFDLTGLYFSTRFKVNDKLSVFGSYDARKNIIYYETYKNFIDQLLEDETRQGLRFSFNFRPWKRISIGSSAGYRFQKNTTDVSKNMNTYLTCSRIPGIQASATLSAVLIESPYMKGIIYGLRVSRDIIRGKLFGEAEFRIVEYQYKNIENPLRQSIAGANLSWRFTKKLSLSVNYEAEIRNKEVFNRIYTQATRRF